MALRDPAVAQIAAPPGTLDRRNSRSGGKTAARKGIRYKSWLVLTIARADRPKTGRPRGVSDSDGEDGRAEPEVRTVRSNSAVKMRMPT
ncbi:hypothetical protein GCM10009764_74660 [Nocardia ninae]|uniref:Uncharacterized protein n=1 Tax=Nocardia ninae NBRC 108245 TaxID=1210091 RepID=A0A511MKZ3_9NOCA|nr:hypothetical protein NN4_56300 [Nocardia ninae NBRC 108245]